MEKIILMVGHGTISEAMKYSVEMIAGTQSRLQYINFLDNMSGVDIYNKIVETMDHRDGMIITDLYGGTPCNEAYKYAASRDNISVLAGLSLSMALSAVLADERLDSEEWKKETLNGAIMSIRDVMVDLEDSNQMEDEYDC